jgi:hypothetical protein
MAHSLCAETSIGTAAKTVLEDGKAAQLCAGTSGSST